MNEDEPPVHLRDSAYRAENGEPAWSRDDAIEVIRWALDRGLAVLGGEIWLPTTPGPTIPSPYIYQWTVSMGETETWGEFVRRSAAESYAYVREFAWADEDVLSHPFEPYFNLVLVNEERA